MTKQGIMIQVDSEFADHLDSCAKLTSEIRSVFIRRLLAEATGYEHPVNERSLRRRKYASAQERADAAKKRQQMKNSAESNAFKALQNGNASEAARIMQEYMEWKEQN